MPGNFKKFGSLQRTDQAARKTELCAKQLIHFRFFFFRQQRRNMSTSRLREIFYVAKNGHH
ncbi:MAG: hypothetical protein D3904_16355 [Candidatus Electrothrix sp. EH2]|nr:hypothetical protein [Candidatus Electrothrix sp. EH2]